MFKKIIAEKIKTPFVTARGDSAHLRVIPASRKPRRKNEQFRSGKAQKETKPQKVYRHSRKFF